jgi:hypothetical protein
MRYATEIMKVFNLVSEKYTYYVNMYHGTDISFMQRISKDRYDEIRNDCDGVCSLSNFQKGNYVRFYTMCVFYVNKG